MRNKTFSELAIIGTIIFVSAVAAAYGGQRDIDGPSGSGAFGTNVVTLPSGNFVVTDPQFDGPGGAANIGAVFVYRPNGSLLSVLIGASPGDQIGNGGIFVLTNGNFVVRSPNFDNGAAEDVGAVTWCNGVTGRNGSVSPTNSLVGSTAFDAAGFPYALTNGNYVVVTEGWDNGAITNVGAATWCNGATGCTGPVTAANSLIGSVSNDSVGSEGVKALTNGHYAVSSPSWDNGPTTQAGAVTWGNGVTGTTGVVSPANSLIGSSNSDSVGIENSVYALTNGNYVVVTSLWDSGGNADVGAVTWCSGATGCTPGPINATNSLVGSASSDRVGNSTNGITALANGNYVVRSPLWNNGAAIDAGAVTFGNGTTGVVGQVSAANSLIGLNEDSVGSGGVFALPNGNYVVLSPGWNNNLVTTAGAVTWCNGTTGRTGTVSPGNSLVGTQTGDQIGGGLTVLTNGNYVVTSRFWNNGAVSDVGAATWGNGTTGITGPVSAANSLVGVTANDQVGFATALKNGHYVVRAFLWDNASAVDAGAVTWGNGTTGIVGPVTAANSFVGTKSGDNIGGSGVFALTNGNYVIASAAWDNVSILDAGAVTWRNGTVMSTGSVSSSNSLIGSAGDFVGNGQVTVLPNGGYVVRSTAWDNGGIVDAGALTYGNPGGGTVGQIGANNSVRGTATISGSTMVSAFNAENNLLVVGRPASNIVSIFYPTKPFDYDGDGRSDLSIYRPGAGQWWLNGSTNGTVAYTFGGVAGDRIMPGDFTGDGKTDVALWRSSTGQWFIQRSEDASFYSFPFGNTSDIPAAGDFDGDGKTDAAVFRPSTGAWFILRSLDGAVTVTPFGSAGDVPAVADYDGDGRSDIAIYRPSNGQWWLNRSTLGTIVHTFGISTDKIMPGDYTGDGRADVAFWRPSTGEWFILRSEDSSYYGFPFGNSSDIPAAADFDGDGKYDVTAFRPSGGTWYSVRSSDAGTLIEPYGINGDIPTPSAFIP